MFISLFLKEREGETEHKWVRDRERETQNPKQAPGSEPSAQSPTRGSNSQTHTPSPQVNGRGSVFLTIKMRISSKDPKSTVTQVDFVTAIKNRDTWLTFELNVYRILLDFFFSLPINGHHEPTRGTLLKSGKNLCTSDQLI